jgi:methanethiol S-methyltransferase
MTKKLGVVYGVAVYLFFLLTFIYAIGFVENIGVPRSIDVGPAAPLGRAILVDLILLGLFAVQHSVMARRGFKLWLDRFIPRPLERSTYVLAATAVLALILWQWRPIPEQIYAVGNIVGVALISAVSILGWFLLLLSTFMIDHFDLFGVRQVLLNYRGIPYRHPEFVQSGFYRYVRHPTHGRLRDRVLGHAGDDGRPSAVRGGHDRLYPDRRPIRGTRHGGGDRRNLSPIPHECADVVSAEA